MKDFGGIKGLDKKEVITLIGKSRWKEFSKWMGGQTIGYDEGTIYYYEHDIQRFIDGRPIVD